MGLSAVPSPMKTGTDQRWVRRLCSPSAAAAASIRPAPASTGSPLPTPAAARAATLVWRLSRLRRRSRSPHQRHRATGEPPSAPPDPPLTADPSLPRSCHPPGWPGTEACAAGSAVITGTSATGATTCSTTAAAPAEPDESPPPPPRRSPKPRHPCPPDRRAHRSLDLYRRGPCRGRRSRARRVGEVRFVRGGHPNRPARALPAGTEAGSVAGPATRHRWSSCHCLRQRRLFSIPRAQQAIADTVGARNRPRVPRASTDCAAASAPESAEPRASAKSQVGIAATADPTPTATAKAPTRPTYRAKPGGMPYRPAIRTARSHDPPTHWTAPSHTSGIRLRHHHRISHIRNLSPVRHSGPHAPRISRRYPSPAPIA